jgi:Uma2 family endonuclease
MAQEVSPDPAGAVSRISPGRMTYEEFLAWADEETRAEWVDGEVIFMSPVSRKHQDLGRFLLALLTHYVEAFRLGVLLYEPFQMKSAPDLPGRSPDLMFVANANLSRLQDTYLDGPADLVVEIISPDSRARDRGDKFYEYEQAGVREYWLLDPQRKQAEFYLLGEDGIYRQVFIAEDGIYRSVVLDGLWLKVEWLWQEPLPPLLEVLREWGLI